MPWRTTSEAGSYLERAGAFLRARPVENTVPLTVAEGLIARPADPGDGAAPLLGWWEDAAGEVAGAVLWTPPHPPLLTAMPAEAVTALVDVIAGAGRPVSGVNATPAAAAAFAAAWCARTGATATRGRRLRLHRLEALAAPHPPPAGRAEVATAAERALLVAWFEAFALEIGEPPVGAARQVEERLGFGRLTLWKVDGEPVSLAGVTRRVAGVARVAPVYTPAEQRGRGYGAAVTAAVCHAALDAGAAEVVLYTDLANATSNRLYERLGFVPVEDREVVVFSG